MLSFKHKKWKWLKLFSAIVALLFIWSRFIEPQWIKVKYSNLTHLNFKKKIILIADQHVGVYKGKAFTDRVVSRINQIPDVDAVLIAGDFLYYPSDFKALAPLKNIKAPMFAVLGNHDVGKPGKDYTNDLSEYLKGLGLQVIDDKAVRFESLNIIGLSDLWKKMYDLSVLDQVGLNDPTIILTHNPDMIYLYPEKLKAAANLITLSGHTHCGQIRIPLLFKKVIPTKRNFSKKGIQAKKHPYKTFVTCGLGEIGLPMRLFNRPTIDVINM